MSFEFMLLLNPPQFVARCKNFSKDECCTLKKLKISLRVRWIHPLSTVNYIAETKEIICFFLWIIKNAFLNDSNGEAWSYKYW